jgi:GDP-L-fucose synthase
MIQKFHEAKIHGTDKVILWGDGSPLREFLYSDDLAEAIFFLMKEKNASQIGDLINIGTGDDLSIKELAGFIQQIIYSDKPGKVCNINWDTGKPNGTPRKLLDVNKLASMGWQSKIDIKDGITRSYTDFLKK